jgi:hypothetical protein
MCNRKVDNNEIKKVGAYGFVSFKAKSSSET